MKHCIVKKSLPLPHLRSCYPLQRRISKLVARTPCCIEPRIWPKTSVVLLLASVFGHTYVEGIVLVAGGGQFLFPSGSPRQPVDALSIASWVGFHELPTQNAETCKSPKVYLAHCLELAMTCQLSHGVQRTGRDCYDLEILVPDIPPRTDIGLGTLNWGTV